MGSKDSGPGTSFPLLQLVKLERQFRSKTDKTQEHEKQELCFALGSPSLQGTGRAQLSPEDLGVVSVGHTVTSAVLPPSRPQPGRWTRVLWGIGAGIVAGQRWVNRSGAARSPRPFCSAIFRQSLTIAEIKEPGSPCLIGKGFGIRTGQWSRSAGTFQGCNVSCLRLEKFFQKSEPPASWKLG